MVEDGAARGCARSNESLRTATGDALPRRSVDGLVQLGAKLVATSGVRGGGGGITPRDMGEAAGLVARERLSEEALGLVVTYLSAHAYVEAPPAPSEEVRNIDRARACRRPHDVFDEHARFFGGRMASLGRRALQCTRPLLGGRALQTLVDVALLPYPPPGEKGISRFVAATGRIFEKHRLTTHTHSWGTNVEGKATRRA